jgi:hypothetical protein
VSDDGHTAHVPLVNRIGETVAHAVIDAADADRIGKRRWYLRGGYATGAETTMHRLILGLIPGDGIEGDHINRDRLDNRRSNLRIVPKGVQVQNSPSRRGASSQYRGVSWHKDSGKWQAEVNAIGARTYLGLFDTEEEAAIVAREARLRMLPYAVD